MMELKRGDKATAHKGSHDFSEGEDLLFVGMDYDSQFMIEAYVFASKVSGNINFLLDGDFSWVN